MADLNRLVQKAKVSAFYMTILNWALSRFVPFNKPHGFRVVEIGDDNLKILLPYRKKNLNHIKGLHACALATISEFTTGLTLLLKLDPKKYRLIMQKLEMEYHFQGKMDAWATFSAPKEWLDELVFTPLKSKESTVVICEVKIHDAKGNHLTTGKVHWQIKDWQKVKTKVS